MRFCALLVAGLLLIPAGCDYFNYGMGRGERPFKKLPPQEGSDSSASAESPAVQYDTSVYVCGVEVKGGYDWRRDTAFGIPDCELLLIRDGLVLLRLPCGRESGVSADPEKHILIDGELYSYGYKGDSTLIRRNGELAAKLPSRETVYGLMPSEDGLLILSRGIDSGVLHLRRGSSELWAGADSYSLGSFDWIPYSRYGAFITEFGGLGFIYTSGGDHYIYIDGETRRITASDIPGYQARARMEEGICTYYCSGRFHYLYIREDGSLRLQGNGRETAIGGDWYFLSAQSYCALGNDACLILNSRRPGEPPRLWRNGEILDPGIENGYLSAVEIVVSPTS